MNRVHENLVLIASIGPVTVNSTPGTSSWVDVSNYNELFAELALGDMANETIDFKIEQATDNSGTGAKDLKAITQLAASAAANDSKQVQISVTTDRLDSENGFKFARIRAVTGNTTGGVAFGSLRGVPRTKPGTQQAAVVQVATL
jgi:hypothetical protein